MKKTSVKTGPKPDHVKINIGWEKAAEKALKKEKPKTGWPKEKAKKGIKLACTSLW